MDVNEIINRKTGSNFETEDLIFVVEAYIKEKKDADVDINITKGLLQGHPLTHLALQAQLQKLSHAFNCASEYYLNK